MDARILQYLQINQCNTPHLHWRVKLLWRMSRIKPTKLQFCIPMIIMGIFGAMNMANMVWRRKKRWWMVSAKRLRLKAVACCYFPVATLTLACPSLTNRKPSANCLTNYTVSLPNSFSKGTKFWSSHHGTAETNLTRNDEVVGSIPGLAQWVSVALSCGAGRRCGSDLALLWPWRRLAATDLIRPLAWEPQHAPGAAIIKRTNSKIKKQNLI